MLLLVFISIQNFQVIGPFSPAVLIKIFNPVPDNKIFGLPKLKAFADDKLNVTQNVEVVFHWIENIVAKEENAG